MTSKHSPGPWRENEHGNLVCYPKGLEVGLLSKQLPDGELEANTSLILAAPDLLEAAHVCDQFLDHLKNSWEVCHHTQAMMDKLKAAIAKAEGRS